VAAVAAILYGLLLGHVRGRHVSATPALRHGIQGPSGSSVGGSQGAAVPRLWRRQRWHSFFPRRPGRTAGHFGGFLKPLADRRLQEGYVDSVILTD